MKSIIFLLLAGTILITSCNSYEDEYNKLLEQNSMAMKRLHALEEEDKLVRGEYSQAIEILNSIEDTLRVIEMNEKEIQALTQQKEFSGNLSQKQAIIAKIRKLRDENEAAKDAAKSMQRRMRSYQIENQQLKKMIAQAENKIVEKEQDLAEAREIIEEMEFALAKMEGQLTERTGQLKDAYKDLEDRSTELQDTNEKLETTITDLKTKSNFIDEQAKAYVACGDKKALRKANILSRTSAKKLTKEYQKNVRENGDEIDYFRNDQIDCGGDTNIERILPYRDESTYSIEGGVLHIKNNKLFWATDKVVVLVKA
jgi:chromosome segregation ATPase